MKKTDKLLLELEKELHDLHECINDDKINTFILFGKIEYINAIGIALKVKAQMRKQKLIHGR